MQKATLDEAQQLCGYRLNKARHYFIAEGVLSTKEHCKGPCPECSCQSDISFCQCCQTKGPGCDYCSHTGRKVERWVRPVSRHQDGVRASHSVHSSYSLDDKFRCAL